MTRRLVEAALVVSEEEMIGKNEAEVAASTR